MAYKEALYSTQEWHNDRVSLDIVAWLCFPMDILRVWMIASLPLHLWFQRGSTCTWCQPRTLTSTGNALCRSHMRTSTSGIFTTPGSSWSCGHWTPCEDTDGTPPGSPLSLGGMGHTPFRGFSNVRMYQAYAPSQGLAVDFAVSILTHLIYSIFYLF